MSLDITLHDPTATYETEGLYCANITHNLTAMASEAGIYDALWRPYRLVDLYKPTQDYDIECEFESAVVIRANDIIDIIEKGLKDLKTRPGYFEQFNSPNGWGVYEHFVPFVENYLIALTEYPDAIVSTDR